MSEIEQGIPENKTFSDRLHQINPIEKLRSKLIKEHHPYGLLLMSVPAISAATGPEVLHINSSGLSSSSLSVDISLDTHNGTPGKLLKDLSSAGALGMFFSGHSPGASLSSAGVALSSMGNEEDRWHTSLGGVLSIFGSSASGPDVANLFRNSFEYTSPQLKALAVPLLAALKQKEQSSFSEERIEVKKGKLRVGSVIVKTLVYNGLVDFNVTGRGMGEPYTIKPGEKFLALHVNQGSGHYSNMAPLSRIKEIRHDFLELCELFENPNKFSLNDEQKHQVISLSEAPMIGVSHLVRLISSRGLPTWDVNALPKFVQRFHAFDSQIVSKLFGGERKVSTADIKVMFLPAKLRSQVLLNL